MTEIIQVPAFPGTPPAVSVADAAQSPSQLSNGTSTPAPTASAPQTRDVDITLPQDKPVVMFFGPASAGKTWALLRLAHYVKNRRALKVQVNVGFREPTKDASGNITSNYYKEVVCPALSKYLDSDLPDQPRETPDTDFAAFDVFGTKGQGVLCRIIEVPGEHLFNVKDTTKRQEIFPPYLGQIFKNRAKKIIIFTVPLPDGAKGEAGALTQEQFNAYCGQIEGVIRRELDPRRDSFLFAVTKADEQTALVPALGRPNKKGFADALRARPGFDVVVRTLQQLNVPLRVLPFSAGTKVLRATLPPQLQFGDDVYPKLLWDEIEQEIEGAGLFAGVKRLIGR